MVDQDERLDNLRSLLEDAARPGSAPRNARAVRELLAQSPESRTHLQALGWTEARLRNLLLLPPSAAAGPEPGPRPDYGAAFAKAERAVAAFLAPARAAASAPKGLLAEIEGLAEEERIHHVSTDARFAEPELVKLLIGQSLGHRYENPDRMLHWAHLARIAADVCTVSESGSEGRLFDLKARAWAHFGNALRVCGRLREAEEALAIAQRFVLQGTGDPLVKARLYEHQASLHNFQRRFDQAIRLTEEAGRIYRDLGETQMLAVTLVSQALACFYSGDLGTAVTILHRAIPMIDSEDDPRLLLAACHNLVLFYIDLELPEQALALYKDTRELYKDLPDTLILLRLSWQEGQLLRDLGRLEDAERALLKARAGFVERGLAYEVAVVSLDLATVYVKLGFVDEVRRTVTEALPTFLALQVDREAVASFLQLQQVADQEVQALHLIRMINARLEQLPGRFRPQR